MCAAKWAGIWCATVEAELLWHLDLQAIHTATFPDSCPEGNLLQVGTGTNVRGMRQIYTM